MIGQSLFQQVQNNMKTAHHHTHTGGKKNQMGQVLLIAILLSTVLLTLGLSLLDLTGKDTRITKIQEDTAKAQAAAEAGIEAALNDLNAENLDIATILNDQNYAGTVTVAELTHHSFTTPLISKDGQYTFFLTGYDPVAKTITSAAMVDNMVINRIMPTGTYCSTDQAFAVELTFLSSTSGVVKRYLIDECNLLDATTDEYTFASTIPTADISPDPSIMIARIISPSNNFDGAKLEIVNATADEEWPAQGKTITSTASFGESNVTKKVQLFQSFPQFPAEFFITQM